MPVVSVMSYAHSSIASREARFSGGTLLLNARIFSILPPAVVLEAGVIAASGKWAKDRRPAAYRHPRQACPACSSGPSASSTARVSRGPALSGGATSTACCLCMAQVQGFPSIVQPRPRTLQEMYRYPASRRTQTRSQAARPTLQEIPLPYPGRMRRSSDPCTQDASGAVSDRGMPHHILRRRSHRLPMPR